RGIRTLFPEASRPVGVRVNDQVTQDIGIQQGKNLLLAAINQIFSLLNPYILGNLIIDPYANRAASFREQGADTAFFRGITIGLLLIIGVAMVSRIAKAFQDYVVNVVIQKFGARLYTDGLRHALRLPFQD